MVYSRARRDKHALLVLSVVVYRHSAQYRRYVLDQLVAQQSDEAVSAESADDAVGVGYRREQLVEVAQDNVAVRASYVLIYYRKMAHIHHQRRIIAVQLVLSVEVLDLSEEGAAVLIAEVIVEAERLYRRGKPVPRNEAQQLEHDEVEALEVALRERLLVLGAVDSALDNCL